MGFIVFCIFAVGVGLFGFGVYWRVQHGTFCDGCKRPTYKCGCEEDGLGAFAPSLRQPETVVRKEATIPTDVTAVVEQAIKARKKPLDS